MMAGGSFEAKGCEMSVTAAWLWLILAIVLEVAGTLCMKLSEGFTRVTPSVLMAVFYLSSLAAMTLSLRRIELGTAYAVWAGIGTALIALIGVVFFREAATVIKLAAITLIITGVAMLHLSSGRS